MALPGRFGARMVAVDAGPSYLPMSGGSNRMGPPGRARVGPVPLAAMTGEAR